MSVDMDQLRAVLFSGLLADTMAGSGLEDRAMQPSLRPVDEGQVVFGRARTGLWRPLDTKGPTAAAEAALIDGLQPGEVVVLACEGPADSITPWGELHAMRARARGAAGCVTQGLVRDVRHLRRLELPVFHGGIAPAGATGRAAMGAIDEPVVVAGVRVDPGDLVFGDMDGVVVIPHAIAAEIIAAALQRLDRLGQARADLEQGTTLVDALARAGLS